MAKGGFIPGRSLPRFATANAPLILTHTHTHTGYDDDIIFCFIVIGTNRVLYLYILYTVHDVIAATTNRFLTCAYYNAMDIYYKNALLIIYFWAGRSGGENSREISQRRITITGCIIVFRRNRPYGRTTKREEKKKDRRMAR